MNGRRRGVFFPSSGVLYSLPCEKELFVLGGIVVRDLWFRSVCPVIGLVYGVMLANFDDVLAYGVGCEDYYV